MTPSGAAHREVFQAEAGNTRSSESDHFQSASASRFEQVVRPYHPEEPHAPAFFRGSHILGVVHGGDGVHGEALIPRRGFEIARQLDLVPGEVESRGQNQFATFSHVSELKICMGWNGPSLEGPLALHALPWIHLDTGLEGVAEASGHDYQDRLEVVCWEAGLAGSNPESLLAVCDDRRRFSADHTPLQRREKSAAVRICQLQEQAHTAQVKPHRKSALEVEVGVSVSLVKDSEGAQVDNWGHGIDRLLETAALGVDLRPVSVISAVEDVDIL